MNTNRKNILIGLILVGIGLCLFMLFAIEIKDGVLHGSRSEGIGRTENPLTFYFSVGFEFLLAVFLLIGGIYFLRQKD